MSYFYQRVKFEENNISFCSVPIGIVSCSVITREEEEERKKTRTFKYTNVLLQPLARFRLEILVFQ